MPDRNIELTRRKILGSLGAVGAAGAAAGYGTSALFSDTESFENNQITAGELDLKVDWEEHYSFPQIYGESDPEAEYDAVRSEDEKDGETDYRAFPPGTGDGEDDPLLWVPTGNVEGYMDATAIDAFPDPNDDGVQEVSSEEDGVSEEDFEGDNYYACDDGADLDDDLDPAGLRTGNADTNADGEGKPLVSLDDVKPGDFGEVTLSTHLCDNDGYLWMTGALDEELTSENGITEPEGDADGEEEGTVELLDEIQCALWYDQNGNNLFDCPTELDLLVLVDTSGSITGSDQDVLENAGDALAEAVRDGAGVSALEEPDPEIQVGLITFGNNSVTLEQDLGFAGPFFDGQGVSGPGDIGDFSYGGNTPMQAAIDAAGAHLNAVGRPNATQKILMVTDGGPNFDDDDPNNGGGGDGSDGTYDVDVDGDGNDEVFGPYTDYGHDDSNEGGGEVNEPELRITADVAQDVRDDGIEIVTVGILTDNEADAGSGDSELVSNSFYDNLNTYLKQQIASSPALFFNATFDNEEELIGLAGNIASRLVACDEIIATGTLGALLDGRLSSGNGLRLDGLLSTTSGEGDDPEPFTASTTHYFGFSWWVSPDTGNEIQSDTVAFDLGFYTEQARNNPTPDGT